MKKRKNVKSIVLISVVSLISLFLFVSNFLCAKENRTLKNEVSQLTSPDKVRWQKYYFLSDSLFIDYPSGWTIDQAFNGRYTRFLSPTHKEETVTDERGGSSLSLLSGAEIYFRIDPTSLSDLTEMETELKKRFSDPRRHITDVLFNKTSFLNQPALWYRFTDWNNDRRVFISTLKDNHEYMIFLIYDEQEKNDTDFYTVFNRMAQSLHKVENKK